MGESQSYLHLRITWGAFHNAQFSCTQDQLSQRFWRVGPRHAINIPRGAENHADLVAGLTVQENVVGVVVGVPIYADGAESDTTKMVRAFMQTLSEKTHLPICGIEENLTSYVAQESMGRVCVRDLKQRLDSESARVILENAIAMINRA